MAEPYPNVEIVIRRAGSSDAAPLSELAATIFHETFGPDNPPETMARYMAEHFTAERQAAEIGDAAGTILLAERLDGGDTPELVGYAHVIQGATPDSVRGETPVELKRFYVARAWHGRGIAQSLMDGVLDAARARGARTIWLGVWERNPRAIAFYAKFGFQHVGEHAFLLGDDSQTDWVMARSLDA